MCLLVPSYVISAGCFIFTDIVLEIAGVFRGHTQQCRSIRTLCVTKQVVNKVEVEAMGNVGVPFFGINLAVGLSLALPGFKSDITKGLLGALPQVSSFRTAHI